MQFPESLTPDASMRAGRMLAAGRLSATVTSKETGEHITVRFKSCKDNRDGEGKNWPQVPFHEASHVFIDVPSAGGGWPDKIGTFYPRNGRFYSDRNADPARVWAAQAVALWVGEGLDWPESVCSIAEEEHCGVCGKELTDPESIARGIGPVCFGRMTESQHQVKVKRQQSLAVDPMMTDEVEEGAAMQDRERAEDERVAAEKG